MRVASVVLTVGVVLAVGFLIFLVIAVGIGVSEGA